MHNVVHIWTGGTMDTLSSPADPCFWLHHSFVDALYYTWQKLHPFNSIHGISDNYNVRLTKIKGWRVEATRGSSLISLVGSRGESITPDVKEKKSDKDKSTSSSLAEEGKAPRCLSYYFARLLCQYRKRCSGSLHRFQGQILRILCGGNHYAGAHHLPSAGRSEFLHNQHDQKRSWLRNRSQSFTTSWFQSASSV